MVVVFIINEYQLVPLGINFAADFCKNGEFVSHPKTLIKDI